MPYAETEILSALQKGVTAAVTESLNPSLPVSYLDVDFDTPNDNKYLEIVHLPNNNHGDYWGQQKNYRGTIRLILHWPKDGSGPYRPLDLLGSIGAHFRKGRLLKGVQIYDMPDYTGRLDGEDDWLYPLSIRYTSYRS